MKKQSQDQTNKQLHMEDAAAAQETYSLEDIMNEFGGWSKKSEPQTQEASSVEEPAAEKVNAVLHEFREFVVGRMGIPYRGRGVNVISVVLDAPQDKISSLSGKLGMIDGVSSKVLTAK